MTEVAHVDGPDAAEVRLDGASAGTATGIDLDADGATVEDLTITSFDRGVDLGDTDSARVIGNRIGIDAAGSADPSLGNQINVAASPPASNGVIARNVIAHGSFGITFRGAGVTGFAVRGNMIGTDSTGTMARGNVADGIEISQGAGDIVIGGSGPLQGNVISGNGGNAVVISAIQGERSQGNRILRNRIGTDADGESAIPNGAAVTSIAVSLSGGIDGTAVRGNTISGNAGIGVMVSSHVNQDAGQPGPTDNVIAGNRLGVDDADAAGHPDALLPNGGTAIEIQGSGDHPAEGNVVGGAEGLDRGGTCTGDCNVVAAVGGASIAVGGADPTATAIVGNHVGVDDRGTTATDAGASAILISGGDGTAVGSPDAPNVIGAADTGIDVGPGATAVTVQSNLIGTASDGGGDLGGGGAAIDASGTPGALVGGTGPGEGNTLANFNRGVVVSGTADGIAVLGNTIRDNDQLAIDLAPVGVTPNDTGVQDGDAGPNGLQNFPELRAAAAGGSTYVVGSLDSRADAEFRIELFASRAGDPSGHGEADTFLGATTVTTDGAGLADFVATVDGVASAGDAITATATELDAAGRPLSTSELAANVTEGDCDPVATGDDDVLCGTAGDDELDGLEGDDVVIGLGGADTLAGSAGDDLLIGDAEDDLLVGGLGIDDLRGGAGDDTLESQDGGLADSGDCGAGVDTASADVQDTTVGCEVIDNPAPGAPGGPAVTDPGPPAPNDPSPPPATGTVPAAPPAPPPSPPPAPPASPPAAPDSSAPKLKLAGKGKQRNRRKVVVKAKCKDEACDLEAKGKIRIKILGRNGNVRKTRSFALERVRKTSVPAGDQTRLVLRFKRKARKKLAKVIGKRKSIATIKVLATDAAGNRIKKTFKVTVKR